VRGLVEALLLLLLLAPTALADTPAPQWSRSAWERSTPAHAVVWAYVEDECRRQEAQIHTFAILATLWNESRWMLDAENSRSTALGVCQFLAGSWREMSARAGVVGERTEAHKAIRVMVWAFKHGLEKHWKGAR
jgi:hypothetical protein